MERTNGTLGQIMEYVAGSCHRHCPYDHVLKLSCTQYSILLTPTGALLVMMCQYRSTATFSVFTLFIFLSMILSMIISMTSWENLGDILGHLGGILGISWGFLGLSWGYLVDILGISWRYIGFLWSERTFGVSLVIFIISLIRIKTKIIIIIALQVHPTVELQRDPIWPGHRLESLVWHCH